MLTGKQIKALRLALRMTQQQFGDEIGVHPVTVGRWERERNIYSPLALRGIEALARRTLSKPMIDESLRVMTGQLLIQTADFSGG